MRPVPITEPGPEVDFPGEGPAGALIAASFQHLTCCLRQVRRSTRSDLVVRMQAVKWRNVPVMRLGFGIRLEPFLQAAVRPDLVRRKSPALLHQLAAEVLVEPEDFGGARGVAEKFAQLLHVDSWSHADFGGAAVGQLEGVLRR